VGLVMGCGVLSLWEHGLAEFGSRGIKRGGKLNEAMPRKPAVSSPLSSCTSGLSPERILGTGFQCRHCMRHQLPSVGSSVAAALSATIWKGFGSAFYNPERRFSLVRPFVLS
jgi:hypothetical protein